MDDTRQRLPLGAEHGQTNAWKGLTDLYRPLILRWFDRQSVPASDRFDPLSARCKRSWVSSSVGGLSAVRPGMVAALESGLNSR
jgi:hypothetical protein